ncbi:MAG TPA: acyl-CoA thioesterase [Fimbriimonadaceae bacterium]|nr:acyl-CoA thioesterase [Fimbriimonadaceae bacterium]
MSARPTKTVASTRVEMSEVMTPGHANFLGKVFGGSILSLLDLCAYTTASRFAENVCVTASFDRVDFHEPIEVGEFVTFVGTVTYAGRTSVEVTIEVFAEDILRRTRRHTNTARVTMVALKDNRPCPVPGLAFESPAEKVKFLEGRLRRELRAAHSTEFDSLAQMFREADEATLDRLMSEPSLVGAKQVL